MMELNISLEYRAFHFSISFGKTLKPKLPQKTQAVSLNAAGKAYLDVIEREYGGTNDLSNLVPVLRDVHQQEFNPWWMGYGGEEGSGGGRLSSRIRAPRRCCAGTREPLEH